MTLTGSTTSLPLMPSSQTEDSLLELCNTHVILLPGRHTCTTNALLCGQMQQSGYSTDSCLIAARCCCRPPILALTTLQGMLTYEVYIMNAGHMCDSIM